MMFLLNYWKKTAFWDVKNNAKIEVPKTISNHNNIGRIGMFPPHYYHIF